MSIKYKQKPKPTYYHKTEKSNLFFDFYNPDNYMEYEGVYTPEDYYVIRDYDLLVRELNEIYSYQVPDFYWNNSYISRGVINLNKDRMYKYLNNKIQPETPIQYDPNNTMILCSEYIADYMYDNLIKATDNCGIILAYRMRYIFPCNKLFISNIDIKKILWVLYADIKKYTVAYSFVPVTNYSSAAFDIIVSNGPYNSNSISKKKHKTLYGYIEYLPRVLNSDMDLIMADINPKTGKKLVLL